MANEVEEFLGALDHPRREEFRALRTLMLSLDPEVSEGVKWKAPSFHYRDWFATFHLRTADRAQVILHTGVKVKASAVDGVPVEDPEGLLKWLAKDRAMLSFTSLEEIEAKRDVLTNLLRQWIRQIA